MTEEQYHEALKGIDQHNRLEGIASMIGGAVEDLIRATPIRAPFERIIDGSIFAEKRDRYGVWMVRTNLSAKPVLMHRSF